MSLIATAVILVVVTQDQAALRAAPRDNAQQLAVLWQGDSLEICGEKQREAGLPAGVRSSSRRAGHIRAAQVGTISLAAADAPELLSVVRFLRDMTGGESLGISAGHHLCRCLTEGCAGNDH